MSKKTRSRLNWIADILEALADGLVTSLEVILSDHGGKRPRRSHRIITQRVYRKPQVVYKHVYKAVPVIVKVKE